jgi:N4-gp56 family major capsid protein
MSNTASTDALRPEIWHRELFADVIDNLYFTEMNMMGKDENNIIMVKDELQKENGDTITFPFTAKLSGAGVSGDNELEGNEERIAPYSEQVTIDQKRFGVRLTGKLDEKKNGFDMRSDAKKKLSIRIQEFIERQVFLKLAGVTNTTVNDINGTVVAADATWSNTPDYIPDADEAAGFGNRYICANTSGTDALGATDLITPALISKARIKALLASPKIQPLKIKGKNYFVMFIHQWQAYDLKRNAEFVQAQREAMPRGEDNPIFTGALGIWDGVIIHEHEYVPFLDVSVAGNSFRGAATGTDCAVDCFRALLCGKQAAGFAQALNPNGWVEKSFDYDNQTGFATGLIGGIQKLLFNSKEYGVIAVDTAATALA